MKPSLSSRVHTSWPNQEQAPRPSNLHQRYVPWSPAGQCTLMPWLSGPPQKYRSQTVMNVYKQPPTNYNQAHCQMPQLQLCTPVTSTTGTLTGATRPPTQMAYTWQTGHPWQMLCFCLTLPKSSGRSHSQHCQETCHVKTVESIHFTHSSLQVWQTINKLTSQTTKPKLCSITTDSILCS